MYENITIRQFENALFRNDRTVLNEEQFKEVYTEYIDTAGLYETEEFQKVSYIYYLNNRINSLNIAIRLQLEFLNEFKFPYVENFKFFKKFGHKLEWKNDHKAFIAQLEKVKLRESKYNTMLESSIKELKLMREKKEKTPEKTSEQTLVSWTRTINSLRKIGWKIDKDTDTVMELAIIIKQQTEETEALKNRK